MRKIIVYIVIILTILISCKKENYDERNNVVGNYSGIKVSTIYHFDDTIIESHTSDIRINLAKSSLDSVININFEPPFHEFMFKYHSEKFTPISSPDSHPPSLRVTADSLFFGYKPGLGPYFISCIAKKE